MMFLLAYLAGRLPWLSVAEVAPWAATGGHPSRCMHKRMTCSCDACAALVAACKRCQRRAAKARKKPRDARGRWTGHTEAMRIGDGFKRLLDRALHCQCSAPRLTTMESCGVPKPWVICATCLREPRPPP